jgi:hypothetical protein
MPSQPSTEKNLGNALVKKKKPAEAPSEEKNPQTDKP